MRAFRPDRVVRTLTALASVAYFGMWVVGALALIAVPAVKLFAGSAADFHYGLELPVVARNLETTVQTAWGPGSLKVDDARGELQLPIAIAPWPFVAALWTYAAAVFALMVLLLQNLRRIFQRVRDGAAFDAKNAIRLRTLSVLLLALAMLNAVAETATSMAVRSGLPVSSGLAVRTGFHIDITLVLVALVLMALAEVFRRGTELEDEQSLVV